MIKNDFNTINSTNLTEIVNEYILFHTTNPQYKSENPNMKYLLPFLEEISQEQTINKIILICKDYISSKNIPFQKAGCSLMLGIIEQESINLSINSLKSILEYVKTLFTSVTCVPYLVKILYSIYKKNYINEIIKQIIIDFVLENYKGEITNIPAYNQETRYYSLLLLNKIIIDKLGSYNNTKNQIELCIVTLDCIDGEKDPRNLILLFQIVKNLCMFIPSSVISDFKTNFFEILKDYYPIDFTPPKDIKNPITAKQLASLLDEAISLEIFNEDYFNNINDYGISSTGDVLLTIQKICEYYSHDILLKNFQYIFNFIINSIYNNNDESIHIESLLTLTIFLKKYSPYENDNNCQLHKTMDNLTDKLFMEDSIKISFDSKDILCAIIEYDYNNIFTEIIINGITKLISLFLFKKRNAHFLKNANSLLFFILKKKDLPQKYKDLLIQKKEMFLSMMKDSSLIKSEKTTDNFYSTTQILISIVDILSALVVKENVMNFNKNEILDVFSFSINNFKLIDLFKEKSEDIEHLSFCICQIDNKYIFNLTQIIINEIKATNNQIVKMFYLIKNIIQIGSNENKGKIFSTLFEEIRKAPIIMHELTKLIENHYEHCGNILVNYKEEIEKLVKEKLIDKDWFSFILILLEKTDLLTHASGLLNNLISNLQHEHVIKILHKYIIRLDNNDLCSELFMKLKEYYFNNNIEFSQDILSELCVCLNSLLPKCSEKTKNDIKDTITETINTLFLIQQEYSWIKTEKYLSILINFYVSDAPYNKEKTLEIISYLLNKIDSFENKSCFTDTELFNINNLEQQIINDLLLLIKPYSNKPKFTNIILNLYSNIESYEYADILFYYHKQNITNGINLQKSIQKLKILLINNLSNSYITRGISFLDYLQIIFKTIEFIPQLQKQTLQIEALKLVGIIKDFIKDNITEEERKKIIVKLRKLLGNKKRQVRKICGIVITKWSV